MVGLALGTEGGVLMATKAEKYVEMLVSRYWPSAKDYKFYVDECGDLHLTLIMRPQETFVEDDDEQPVHP